MSKEGRKGFWQRLNLFKSKVADDHGGTVKLIVKPLRIFQFLVVLLIFVLVIYAVALGSKEVSAVTCILLVVLSGVYVFALAVQLISYFAGGELYTIMIFVLSFMGAIQFGISGIFLLLSAPIQLWYMLVTMCLCLLAFMLFLIEVIIILLFWKQTCFCKRCAVPAQADVHFDDYCDPQCTAEKLDLMTSVSDVRIPPGNEEGIPEHCYRKLGQPRRRQYIDRPSSARFVCDVEFAKCQTDSTATTHIQSQTQRQVWEKPTQTVSKCELCHRQMGMFTTAMETQPMMQQQAPCAPCSPCAPCPALVQLIRGMPCCPGCRCVTTGIVQLPQQGQQQQTVRQDQEQSTAANDAQKTEQKNQGALTSEQEEKPMAGVPGTVTKLTVASYCVTPSRRTEIYSQTAGEDPKCMRMSDDTEKKVQRSSLKEKPRAVSLKSDRSTKSSVDPSFDVVSTDPTVTTDQSEIMVKTVSMVPPKQKVAQMINLLQELEECKAADSPAGDEERSGDAEKEGITTEDDQFEENAESGVEVQEDEEKVEEIDAEAKTVDEELAKSSVVTDKSIGSELTSVDVSPDESAGSSPRQSDVSKREISVETSSAMKHGVETQATDPSRVKKSSFLKKKNKVEPTEHETEADVHTWCSETMSETGPAVPCKAEPEKFLVDKRGVLGEMPTCPACKRVQYFSVSPSFYYYSVYRDKRGRLYCDYCAPKYTVKVLYRHDPSDQKFLKCAQCSTLLRQKTSRSEYFRNKNDNCPRCTQVQGRVHSARK